MKKESNVIKEDKRLNTLMEIEEYCKWEDFKEGDRIPVSSPSPNIPDTLKIKESVMTEVDNIIGVVEENRKKVSTDMVRHHNKNVLTFDNFIQEKLNLPKEEVPTDEEEEEE